VLLVGPDIAEGDVSPSLRERGLRALLGVPLAHDGTVIGVAHIGSTSADHFSDPERRLLLAMAERAAWVVSRHHARERLYDVLNAAPASISVWRAPEYTCEFANEAYRRRYGGEDPVQRTLRQHGASAEMIAMFDRVIATGHDVSSEEYPMRWTWDGTGVESERFFSFTLHALRDQLGRPSSVLSFAVDVTEPVLARRALERSERDRAQLLELERTARREAELANRAKDEFLATVSHELRTPLNAILGWTASVRRGVVKDVDRALAIIDRNARAQARIIEDVLDLSRVVSGKLRLDVVPTDIMSALSGAIEAVRPGAEAKGITLTTQIEDLGVIAADSDRIQQVVWNLLSNAVKFTTAGGRVELTGTRRDGKVVIRVKDTGQGIAPDFLPHVFEPFRQADGSTTRRHGGLGLGLAIVSQLVHAHGGAIRAESDGIGQGSTFTVELPSRAVAFARPLRERSDRPRGGVARLDGVRVLVVDDEDDARDLVGEVLEKQGARVELASSADEALTKVRVFRPHVMITDIGMPAADGFALLEHVRALPTDAGGATAAIALTAYARPEDADRAARAGFQMHVAKPVDPVELVACVSDAARSRRAASG
jgi:signal transduction histidine kinase/ActR/RegA family two-component response regulator